MEIMWLVLAVAMGVIEALTAQFVSIWFAGGAVCALAAQLLGADTYAQCAVFVAASAVLLVCTRPVVRKLTSSGHEKTNADSVIGKQAVMTRSTDSRGNGGEAKISGKFWTVCTADGQPVEENSVVTVEKIEGVKLIVRK